MIYEQEKTTQTTSMTIQSRVCQTSYITCMKSIKIYQKKQAQKCILKLYSRFLSLVTYYLCDVADKSILHITKDSSRPRLEFIYIFQCFVCLDVSITCSYKSSALGISNWIRGFSGPVLIIQTLHRLKSNLKSCRPCAESA